ncbi:putative single-stranded DNA binding protein of prophage [Escherichia coli]|nr:putative single-stranded DNA binding protein of prophage [Escherichia coli]
MSNIKKYIIDYDWKASIEIEIDHDFMTEEKLHQINNFWSDSEYRLNKHGSVLNAVLIMLAQHALNRPGFPGECFICELRLPDHRF